MIFEVVGLDPIRIKRNGKIDVVTTPGRVTNIMGNFATREVLVAWVRKNVIKGTMTPLRDLVS